MILIILKLDLSSFQQLYQTFTADDIRFYLFELLKVSSIPIKLCPAEPGYCCKIVHIQISWPLKKKPVDQDPQYLPCRL